jgi:hypothetical protein
MLLGFDGWSLEVDKSGAGLRKASCAAAATSRRARSWI